MRKSAIIIALTALMASATVQAAEVYTEGPSQKEQNQHLWKGGNKEFRLGYTFGNFDRSEAYGGTLNSRVGVNLDFMRNIYFHRSAIGGFMKIGIQFGPQITYLNYEKGHGSLKDAFDGIGEDEDLEAPNLGKHQIIAGIGIGPTVTIMPCIWSSQKNLARLKVRLHFNVVPAYSGFMTVNDDEMELHSAFACLFAGGINVSWRKLDIGFQYKGGRARYKNLVEDLVGEVPGAASGPAFIGGSSKTPRFANNLYTISVGLAF